MDGSFQLRTLYLAVLGISFPLASACTAIKLFRFIDLPEKVQGKRKETQEPSHWREQNMEK